MAAVTMQCHEWRHIRSHLEKWLGWLDELNRAVAAGDVQAVAKADEQLHLWGRCLAQNLERIDRRRQRDEERRKIAQTPAVIAEIKRAAAAMREMALSEEETLDVVASLAG